MKQDFASLRAEGIRQLERLAGPAWTDFNAHDPGITFLEQICYVLTDLEYRIGFGLPDLLARAGEETYEGLFGPDRILVSRPVTLLDLRKLVLDVPGVANAWIEQAADASPKLYFQESSDLDGAAESIRLAPNDESRSVPIKGLYRVLIDPAEESGIDSAALIAAVAARLHANRCLCADVASVSVPEMLKVAVHATVEIEPAADSETVYLAMLEEIDAYLTPSVRFHTLSERLDSGYSLAEIFEGPLLTHGFLDDDELQSMPRRTSLYTSDLLCRLMDVPGVRMVDFLAFSSEQDPSTLQSWALDLAPSVTAARLPRFDHGASRITLQRKQIRLNLNTEALHSTHQTLRLAPRTTAEIDALASATIPWSREPGRDRQIGRYASLMQDLPAVYGVGAAGLPDGADSCRRAQARQLKAYLLFFDQLMSNQFAQLAHLRDLLGFAKLQVPSYFAGEVELPADDAPWRQPDAEARRNSMRALTKEPSHEPESPQNFDWARRNRFLDHLLARFGDSIHDFTHHQAAAETSVPVADQAPRRWYARSKQALLTDYPEASGGRGSGADLMTPAQAGEFVGVERRIRAKLGLFDSDREPPAPSPEALYLVEHLLLRPGPADEQQRTPMLVDARCPDPYSLQISAILNTDAPLFASVQYRRYAERVIREEIPAHLVVYVLWLDSSALADFEPAYRTWRQAQADHLSGGGKDRPDAVLFRLRDARDRLIERLGLGRTYPLRDTDLDTLKVVDYDTPATLTIRQSQRNVTYELRDIDGKALDATQSCEGNGSEVSLTTPSITYDRSFTVRANKHGDAQALTVLLDKTILVKVGLKKALRVEIIDADPLEPRDPPQPSDPWLLDYGAQLKVRLSSTQENVSYQLVTTARTALSPAAGGDPLHDIDLTSEPLKDDIDVRIQASRNFGGTQKPEDLLLDTILSIKIRPNTALRATIDPTTLEFGGTSAAVTVAGTQPLVRYQAYIRPIADAEFVHSAPLPDDLVIAPAGQQEVRVRIPSLKELRQVPTGFQKIGDVITGSDAPLTFPLGRLTADTLVVVAAEKDHLNSNRQTVTPAPIPLDSAAAVLVRPDPNPSLKLNGVIEGGAIKPPVTVTGGQPGVFYRFRLADTQDDLAAPVYFHQKNPADAARNKGVDALVVETDLVVAPTIPPDRLAAHPDLATLAPEPPLLLLTSPLPADAKFTIVAVKAQTRLETVINRSVAEMLTDASPPTV